MTIDWFVWLAPLLLLPIVALFVFVGCHLLLPMGPARSHLKGQVTSTAGGPVSGANVTAGSYSATTDSTGSYSMDVDPGTYDVAASATGFKSAPARPVTLQPGETVPVDFPLEPVESTLPPPPPVVGPGTPNPSGIPNLQVHTKNIFWTQEFSVTWTFYLPGGGSTCIVKDSPPMADFDKDKNQDDVTLKVPCNDGPLGGISSMNPGQISCECTVTYMTDPDKSSSTKTIVVSPKQGPNPLPYPPDNLSTMDWVLTRTDTWQASKDAYSLEPNTS